VRWSEAAQSALGFLLLSGAAYAQESEAPSRGSPVEVVRIFFPERAARNLDAGGSWVPLYFELRARSDGAEVVTVEATVTPAASGKPFVTRSRFEVPPGPAPRRAWLYLWARPEESFQRATINITCRGERVPGGDQGARDLSIRSEHHRTLTVLAVGMREGEVTPWRSGDLTLPQRAGSLVVSDDGVQRMELHQLPDRSIGYQAMDVVLLRGADEKRLEPGQIAALRHWVFLGGRLILAPAAETGGAVFQGELARELLQEVLGEIAVEHQFLPADLHYRASGDDAFQRPGIRTGERRVALAKDVQLRAGTSLTRWDPVDPARGAGRLLREIRSGASSEVVPLGAGKLLYGETSYGSGRVGLLTIDDQALDARASGELSRQLWSQILAGALEERSGRGTRQRLAQFVRQDIAGALKDKKREVGMLFIFILVTGYLLIVGPGVYFLLKRRNCLPAIIWVEPLVIAVYIGVIFLAGYLTKGVLTKLRLVTLIHQREGEALSLRESYLTIFSADSADYRIEAPRGEVLNPLFANREESQAVRLVRAQGGAGSPGSSVPRGQPSLVLEGHHLDLWQQGYAFNAGVEEGGAGVEVRLSAGADDDAGGEGAGSPVRCTVTNRLPYAIRAAWVETGRGKVRLPPLGSGATLDLVLPESDPGKEESDDGSHAAMASVLGLYRGSIGGRGRLFFYALIDRQVEDFRLDRPFSLAERLDAYFLYR
jgi:hypothetical protein